MKRFRSIRTRPASLRLVPRLEVLEDRCCPSCTTQLVSIVDGQKLTILGDQRDNVIDITDNGSTVDVVCDGVAAGTFDDLKEIVLRSRAGADTVTYTLNDRSDELHLDIALQQGADIFNANFNASLSAGAELEIEVNAGKGVDTLNLTAQDIDVAAGARLKVALKGNNAKDAISIDYQGNIAGTLDLLADGGKGQDEISASVTGDIGAIGLLRMRLDGGNGVDSISASYAGLLNGDLDFAASGGLAGDTVSADLTADSGSTGDLKALVEGNNGRDDLTLLVHDNSGDDGDNSTVDVSTLNSLDAILDTGPGQDSATATDNVTVI